MGGEEREKRKSDWRVGDKGEWERKEKESDSKIEFNSKIEIWEIFKLLIIIVIKSDFVILLIFNLRGGVGELGSADNNLQDLSQRGR